MPFAYIQTIIFMITFTGFVLGLAIMLLVLFQLSHDATAITFLFVAAIITGVTMLSCLLQIRYQTAVLNATPSTLLNILGSLLFVLPFFLFVFTVQSMTLWTRERVAIAVLHAIQGIIAAVMVLRGEWIAEAHFESDGALGFTTIFTPFSVFMNFWLTGNTWYGFYRFARQIRTAPPLVDRRFIFGVLLIYTGIASNTIYVATQYSIGTNLMVCGVLMLTPPILKNRLFDPISKLNNRLSIRAEQMALIAKISHYAHSIFSINELLPAAAGEICRAFGYSSVQITVSDGEHRSVEYGLAFADGQAFNSATYANAATILHSPCVNPAIEIAMAITPPDVEKPLSGLMKICHSRNQRSEADEAEVLQILAQQIALAISNAQLFQETQRANIAKMKFISYVSHELRNGVGNVIGLADGILHDPIEYENQPLPKPYEQDMQTILQTGRHLKALLTDIVNWGQIESGRMKMSFQDIDPVPILDEVFHASAGVVRNGVELRRCYKPGLPPIRADQTRIKQILSNLIGNAAKFTVSGAITLDACVRETFLCFSVADTGKGMTREEQSRLFQAYAQASDQTFRDYGGNGLGLHISEQIIHLHGGVIWLESQPGVGTTFYFTIPLVALSPETAEFGISQRV